MVRCAISSELAAYESACSGHGFHIIAAGSVRVLYCLSLAL
jgi:hypothetical protein